jgi:polysaccharide pyruvyl transferase WcaK-like protein
MHLANFNGTNIGNGALIHGTERVLSEDSPVPIQWVREAWDDYTFGKRHFDRSFVQRVNETDGLIVGGAVTFNGRPYLTNAGMRFDLPIDLFPEIRKPIVFYGVSYRHWSGQPFHHLDKLKAALGHLLGRANCLFAVRNDGTKVWLERLLGGAEDPRIREVPDPAVFTPADEGPFPEILAKRTNILFAPNGEDAEHRFGSEGRSHEETRLKLIEAVARVLARTVDETDANLILAPHYLDDFGMIADLLRYLPPQIAHQSTVALGLARVPETRSFYGRYALVDAAISMRVHSMSPALGIGTPMVAIVTQDRMWEFLRRAGVDDLMVDGFSDSLENDLGTRLKMILTEGSMIRARFGKAREKFRAETRQVNTAVFGILGR